ncbi:putative oxidoreductase YfjR [Hypsizygus marmoreus]|uniref:Oxidoreductase YfjR n=1 Tax=Hypsizygus marmoreus TaxID=39966 RepID=A0A369KAA9_HYPMA|nr:putative oxidoreductase YfjR [Hypsizygus marmoreus]
MSSLLHTLHQDAVPYSRPITPASHHPTKIGFVGLGSMGYLIAQNLANYHAAHSDGNPPVLVWNRSAEKSEKLLQALGKDKIRIAQDLGQVATECDVIITNLANDAAVKSVYEKFTAALTHLPPTGNKIFVETSTIYPSLAGELDALVSSIPHSHLITCPVFGTPAVAEKAQLLIIMSGDYRSKKEVAYLLVPAVGRKVIDLGGNLEKAPTFKLIGNSMILGTLEILAEAFTLAEKSGIGAENVHNLVKEILPAPGTIAYSDKMANDKFDGKAGFAIDGGIKDASHIRKLTAELNSPMPAIDIAHQHLLTARAIHQGHKQEGTAKFETLDWSGIIAGTRVAAGLDGLDSQKHDSIVRED